MKATINPVAVEYKKTIFAWQIEFTYYRKKVVKMSVEISLFLDCIITLIYYYYFNTIRKLYAFSKLIFLFTSE